MGSMVTVRHMSKQRRKGVESYAEMFKALSNPHRLRIFLRLASCCAPGTRWKADASNCACVGELGADLGIVPSTVSHHIKELVRAGLIRTERRGQTISCWVDPEVLRTLAGFFREAACG